MQVQQLMTKPVLTCGERDTLAAAARLMWENDCGSVVVLDDRGQLAGMVTDRDICMATFTQGAPPHAIGLADIVSRRLVTCRPTDTLGVAEGLMRNNQIRRLPVVDDDRRVVGMLSLNDVARYVAHSKPGNGVDRELVQTLAAIGERRSEQRAGVVRV